MLLESAFLFKVASGRLSSCGQGHRKEPGFMSRVQAPCLAEVIKAMRATQHGVLFQSRLCFTTGCNDLRPGVLSDQKARHSHRGV